MTTELTFWGHACVRLERAGSRLVIDPGAYSDREAVSSADAVLITHEHADHVVVGELRSIVENNSQLEVWAPDAVIAELSVGDGAAERLHRVRGGDRFVAAGFDVEALGEWHAVVHPDIPRVPNVGYLIDGAVLHPGDSFTQPATGRSVEVLLAPVGAPWLRIAHVIDYVRAVRPRVVVPIHDAHLSDLGNVLVDRLVGSLGGSESYRRLGVGEGLEVG
jgi:L-ascorbate metabolism protein UlaG (beta-lactamase superfamily)